jgi:hypothetical protein
MRASCLLLVGLALVVTSPVQGAVASSARESRVALPFGAALRAEVRGDADGAYAYRLRTSRGEPLLPRGEAVLIEEAWWTPLRALRPLPERLPSAATLELIGEGRALAETGATPEHVDDTSLGDATGDGQDEVVISFRRPFRPNYINVTRPREAWTDAAGHSAHLGLYRPQDLSTVWIAGTLVRPVTDVVACDGALAVAYGAHDGEGTVATGAWEWFVYGFLPADPLPGPGTPTCVDIDGDGRSEPAILERSQS